ncbi:laccase domain protein [Paraoerskovia sediminicola]|uniref:Purine nucleoside phosphorylase n=1 Tax=Paraoerskovia sediminicola TaxID=1138587 RepID=A0ABM8G6R5_9CELL|nr:peptidoglycan editing factor PgeF [Paraoerskovia sediminicola]BDZ43834.1 laccase domain protein [Paraoerskovia sediminicola]
MHRTLHPAGAHDPDDVSKDVVRVDLGPGVVAAFTTRHGGSSPAPWSSWNLGLNVSDDPDRVRANRSRLARVVGAETRFVRQVHGVGVVPVVREHESAAGGDGLHDPWGGAQEPEGDALVTAEPGLALGILVADCVPVLLADPVHGVVAAAHAGRRGLDGGVVAATVAAMVDAGAVAGDVRAVVGPSICARCYEVPEEMRADVAARVPAAWATSGSGTPALDLPGGVRAELTRSGVGQVGSVDVCTREDDRFYSHRRATAAGSVTGRFAGVLALRADK